MRQPAGVGVGRERGAHDVAAPSPLLFRVPGLVAQHRQPITRRSRSRPVLRDSLCHEDPLAAQHLSRNSLDERVGDGADETLVVEPAEVLVDRLAIRPGQAAVRASGGA